MNFRFPRACALATLALFSCGGPSVHVSQPVGAAGGAVAAPDGTAVSIPAGALPGDASITIESAPDAPRPSGTTAVGTPYLFEPEGTQFALPITVTLVVDPSKLPPGKSIGDVVAYTAPAGSSAFKGLPTQVADATHVKATTTHFSIIVAGVPTTSTDCLISCSGSASSTSAPTYQCQSKCMGHDYQATCSGTSCACKQDGVAAGSAPFSGSDGVAGYKACGFPGELPCSFSCGANSAASSGGSGGTDPGSPRPSSDPVVSCSCYGSCMGTSHVLTCRDGSCTCGGGSTTTDPGGKPGGSGGGFGGTSFGFTIESFSFTCDLDTTALEQKWMSECGYPGTVAPPPMEEGAAGTKPSADGGVVDPGGGADGGSSDTPDLAMGCAKMAGGTSTMCMTHLECGGHSYVLDCDGSNCRCISDGMPGTPFAQGNTCADPATNDMIWKTSCGFPDP